MTSSSTVSAANIASGIEGTLGSVDINGCDTMYDYIKHDFTYTDQMTVNDYKTARSASYDRNETSTGKNSTDYLLQSVEWTDVKNGEALLSVAGKDTTESTALFVFSPCTAVNGKDGGPIQIIYKNIVDLLTVYDRVDVLTCNSDRLWGTTGTARGMCSLSHGDAEFMNIYKPIVNDSRSLGTSNVYNYGSNYNSAFSSLGTNIQIGLQPYYSFRREDYPALDTSNYYSSTNYGLMQDVYYWARGMEWGTNTHPNDLLLPMVYAYMVGDLSYEDWNFAQTKTYYADQSADSDKYVYGQDDPDRPAKYLSALNDVFDLSKPFDESMIVNHPTAVYMFMSDPGYLPGVAINPTKVGTQKAFLQYLVDSYQTNDQGWVCLDGGLRSWDKALYSNDFKYDLDYAEYGSNYTKVSFPLKELSFLAACNPSYALNNYETLLTRTGSAVARSTHQAARSGVPCYTWEVSVLKSGALLPDKKLSFDIPIGDSWQVDMNNLSSPNIIYTYQYSNTGEWANKSTKGENLEAIVSIDANNVIHITTNTYVKGAEISIQIPLKYSANGVQSAKQLRVGEDGKVYTDGKSGTPVADTYVISMTAGDTKLHVGPDILGDLDTSLSIYMPSSDLMDVQVNLHWMNDSDTIKGMLGDTSVRGNATALIGSDALVGTMLGKQSDDDEKAGGIGTSVVAMNFADANGSVGTIASSYTDSDGITKQLSNGSVDLQLRTKNGAPDLWTDAKDEAGENNVVTYMMFNVPRFGHPTANTYDANGNVTGVTDLASGVVPRYYYVEDVVNVPAGYTAYNITNMASSDLEKLQKTTGSDTENPMTYNKVLYYAYTVTPPSDWNSSSKVTYTIDCYVALDIKSLKMTVEHYQEQLTGDGYTPSTNKQYKLESSIDSYEAITSVYSPEVKTYAGYDSPDRQSLTVTVTGDHVIKYYYDLHYYDINVDTQGGEWFEEQDDGTWNAISEPPAHYTILTPTFTLPIPDKVGFDFEGYTGTGLTKPTLDVTIPKGTTGDKDYKANWIAQAYDVEVPVSLIFSASYDGVMKGAFDQNGSGKVADTGFLLNNSKFPVQVTHITYNNDSVYTMSDVKSDKPNIMNWRLDATNPDTLRSEDRTYNVWATALDDTVNVSDCETYWMAQNSDGKVILDSDQAWYRNDVPDIKDTTKIGNIVWTFGIGHRNVVERPIVAAK